MWTSHTLPILANYSQFISGFTIFGGVATLYFKHRCHHCHRVARFRVGPHQVPVCHRHRQHEDAAAHGRAA